MNESEYMNPTLFPLTTQPGLSIDQQMLIDSHNIDTLDEAVAAGSLLTPDEQAVAAELNRKRDFIKQMANARTGGGP